MSFIARRVGVRQNLNLESRVQDGLWNPKPFKYDKIRSGFIEYRCAFHDVSKKGCGQLPRAVYVTAWNICRSRTLLLQDMPLILILSQPQASYCRTELCTQYDLQFFQTLYWTWLEYGLDIYSQNLFFRNVCIFMDRLLRSLRPTDLPSVLAKELEYRRKDFH